MGSFQSQILNVEDILVAFSYACLHIVNLSAPPAFIYRYPIQHLHQAKAIIKCEIMALCSSLKKKNADTQGRQNRYPR